MGCWVGDGLSWGGGTDPSIPAQGSFGAQTPPSPRWGAAGHRPPQHPCTGSPGTWHPRMGVPQGRVPPACPHGGGLLGHFPDQHPHFGSLGVQAPPPSTTTLGALKYESSSNHTGRGLRAHSPWHPHTGGPWGIPLPPTPTLGGGLLAHTPPAAPLQGDSHRAQAPQHPHTGGVLQPPRPHGTEARPHCPTEPRGGGAGAPLAQGAAGAAAAGRGAAAAAAFAQPLAQQFLSRSHKTCLTCPAPLRQAAATQRLRREGGWRGPAAPRHPPALGSAPHWGGGDRSCIPLPP